MDHYFEEGGREALFPGRKVVKYHRPPITCECGLAHRGFAIMDIAGPEPSERMLREVPEMRDEVRRPLMLLGAPRR